ncbi:SAM-dependent methyltransferase [Rhodoligotrophos appendicifer]|uniref:SAM-dependent methyltransferase n=1 Tax=Rhodoligotrophos appendicifer TaxID=987056 RepID=UPI0011854366|nr:cyclopropane-fatty-acyl-phospholipid synthase family protein [Rhodoligotrophos appendicifer]
MLSVLKRIFSHIVRHGTLTVIDASGNTHRFGDATGVPIVARISDPSVYRKLAFNPELHLGEVYMDGSLSFEQGTIYDFLEVLLSNMERMPYPRWLKVWGNLRYRLRKWHQHNPIWRARKNIAHHYDLDGAMYDLFLDRDRQYSCAYFEHADSTLEDAQLAKKRHLAAKLDLQPGQRVLDIGSGWGGLGIYLAEVANVNVTGVTLSEEQHKISNERAACRGLGERVQFLLRDYRTLNGKFDRIVSVGMFEHVGAGHYSEFFTTVRNLLTDDGVAVLHSINRSDGPGATNPWIAKHIFPGGAIPALSEVTPVIEKSLLYITDIEILRLHYADTLREWRHRFITNWDRAKAIYDERFCRMWEFYLAASETAFRFQGMNNFQIQFTKSQHALPITRDYIVQEEDRLRRLESRSPQLVSVPAE